MISSMNVYYLGNTKSSRDRTDYLEIWDAKRRRYSTGTSSDRQNTSNKLENEKRANVQKVQLTPGCFNSAGFPLPCLGIEVLI